VTLVWPIWVHGGLNGLAHELTFSVQVSWPPVAEPGVTAVNPAGTATITLPMVKNWLAVFVTVKLNAAVCPAATVCGEPVAVNVRTEPVAATADCAGPASPRPTTASAETMLTDARWRRERSWGCRRVNGLPSAGVLTNPAAESCRTPGRPVTRFTGTGPADYAVSAQFTSASDWCHIGSGPACDTWEL
jgi:hypothetical protein